jgi:cytochrome o ubiquinol oxidase subunit 2
MSGLLAGTNRITTCSALVHELGKTMEAKPGARIVRRVAALAPLFLLAACEPAVLDPQGPVGSAEKTILIDSVAIMLAIVVPTLVAVFAFAWWFRASNKRARYLPEWDYSGKIELVTWSIPVLVIILLGGVAWIGSHTLDPAEKLVSDKKEIEVQVVSLDWKWLFIYPQQHVASVNELVVPAGTPIHFALTSSSVMNTFFVPQLGSMIYTMHGMTTQLNLSADHPGSFRGQSSHYSGDGFSDMHFEMRAVSDADFTSWVAATRTNGKMLDEAAYLTLEKQSQNITPFTYNDVAPDLFSKIVSGQLPAGPGPDMSNQAGVPAQAEK